MLTTATLVSTGEWPDVVAVRRAAQTPPSHYIEALENSFTEWKEQYVEMKRRSEVILPMDGSYCLQIVGKYMLVELWKGTMVIDTLLVMNPRPQDGDLTYGLTKPITFKAAVGMLFNFKGHILTPYITPPYGFHLVNLSTVDVYTDQPIDIAGICTGELNWRDIENQRNPETLKAFCVRIVETLRSIYGHSCGLMRLPKRNPYNILVRDIRKGNIYNGILSLEEKGLLIKKGREVLK